MQLLSIQIIIGLLLWLGTSVAPAQNSPNSPHPSASSPTPSPQNPYSPYSKTPKKNERSSKPSANAPNAPNVPNTKNAIGSDSPVATQFAAAQKLYNAGKYPAALRMYDSILRKYPSHEPSTVQYAKTLYRMDRIQESYAMFARINPTYLDPETSYEYGWSFFVNRQYEGALFAFRRIPQGHALFDLANYYGGICAIKLRRYQDAEDLLEKAVVLPDKLARSRQVYLKHAQELRLLQEKNALTRERQDEKRRINAETAAANTAANTPLVAPGNGGAAPVPTSVQSMPNAAPPLPSIYVSFNAVTMRSADVTHSQTEQTIDNHGYKQENAHITSTQFSFFHGPIKALGPWFNKDVPNDTRKVMVGLLLGLTAQDRIQTGVVQRILIEEDNSDLVRLQSVEKDRVHSQIGTVSAEPWIEMPFPGSFWAYLGLNLDFAYPEMKRAGRTGTRGTKAGVGLYMPSYEFEAGDVYVLNVASDSSSESSTNNAFLRFRYTSATKLSTEVTAGYKYFGYIDVELDGPDNIAYSNIDLYQEIPLGFGFELFGAFEHQTNVVRNSLPTFGSISADADVLTGKAILSAKPFSWISGSVSQLYQKTTWKVDDEAAQDTFEKNVANFLSTLNYGVSVIFNF